MDIEEKIKELVSANQLDQAIKLATEKLISHPPTEFNKIIGKNLLHLTDALIHYLDTFYSTAREQTEVKAIFAEMNGFTINYDLWFINLFAYDTCGGVEDSDWLAEDICSSEDGMIISGFEDVQLIYQDYMENEKYLDDRIEEASEACERLIVLRLQELLKAAKTVAVNRKSAWLNIPLFVTAHDYDMLYEVKI